MSRCIDCVYAKFQLTDKGNVKKKVYGQCTYEVEIPKLPWCVDARLCGRNFISRIAIWYNTCKDCPCFIDKNNIKEGNNVI